MGKLDNKVAVVSGAARGQGRSHAVNLAARRGEHHHSAYSLAKQIVARYVNDLSIQLAERMIRVSPLHHGYPAAGGRRQGRQGQTVPGLTRGSAWSRVVAGRPCERRGQPATP